MRVFAQADRRAYIRAGEAPHTQVGAACFAFLEAVKHEAEALGVEHDADDVSEALACALADLYVEAVLEMPQPA